MFPGKVTHSLECEDGSFACRDKSRCVKRSSVCDGKNDCLDGSDEKYCKKPRFFKNHF